MNDRMPGRRMCIHENRFSTGIDQDILSRWQYCVHAEERLHVDLPATTSSFFSLRTIATTLYTITLARQMALLSVRYPVEAFPRPAFLGVPVATACTGNFNVDARRLAMAWFLQTGEHQKVFGLHIDVSACTYTWKEE